MDLPLEFTDSAVHYIQFEVGPALNYAKIFEMPFLYKFKPSIDWKNHIITWWNPQFTFDLPSDVSAEP